MQGTRVDDPHRPCTRNVAAATHPGDSAGQRQPSTLTRQLRLGLAGWLTHACARCGWGLRTLPPQPCRILVCGIIIIVREKDTCLRRIFGGSSGRRSGRSPPPPGSVQATATTGSRDPLKSQHGRDGRFGAGRQRCRGQSCRRRPRSTPRSCCCSHQIPYAGRCRRRGRRWYVWAIG